MIDDKCPNSHHICFFDPRCERAATREGQLQSDGHWQVILVQLLPGLIRLSRPLHWAKNVFVLLPLMFSKSLENVSSSLAALIATLCFCFLSSAVYAFNDIVDAKADQQHPTKCRRPIPSGQVTMLAASVISLGLTSLAVVLAYVSLPTSFLLFGGLYLGNSLVYCLFLKHRAIADVMGIAIGFTIRLLAGCAAIQTQPSSWILVCGFSLAMLLGFGKRRTEVVQSKQLAPYRPVLWCYSAQKLDTLLAITSSVCLLAYMLYTTSPATVQVHGTTNLVYTVPFVAYGIFRYILKVQEGKEDGPIDILLKDPVFALNCVLWLLTASIVLYLL